MPSEAAGKIEAEVDGATAMLWAQSSRELRTAGEAGIAAAESSARSRGASRHPTRSHGGKGGRGEPARALEQRAAHGTALCPTSFTEEVCRAIRHEKNLNNVVAAQVPAK